MGLWRETKHSTAEEKEEDDTMAINQEYMIIIPRIPEGADGGEHRNATATCVMQLLSAFTKKKVYITSKYLYGRVPSHMGNMDVVRKIRNVYKLNPYSHVEIPNIEEVAEFARNKLGARTSDFGYGLVTAMLDEMEIGYEMVEYPR